MQNIEEHIELTQKYIEDYLLSLNFNRTKISISDLSLDLTSKLPQKITLLEFLNFVSDYCASKISFHPEFNKIASQICIDKLHKITDSDISIIAEKLYFNNDLHNKHTPLISEKLYITFKKYSEKINKIIDYNRDFDLDYFGIKTLEKSYLIKIKINNKSQIIERPQHLFMRVAFGIHEDDFESAIETYENMSKRYFTHATPTLFNAGTTRMQMSSCFLLACGDSMESIMDQQKEMGMISKWSGGIGIHFSGIRGKGSLIRGTNGLSDGIIPLCIYTCKLSRYVNQGGKRGGAISCFCEDMEVLTINEGVKQIKDVKIGDLVVTHKNRVKPVVQVHKNLLGDRKIYKLKVEKNKDIYVTGNHRFWSFYTKKNKSEKISLGWNSIEELKELMDNKKTKRQSCYISIPTSTNITDVQDYKINVLEFESSILNDRVTKIKEIENNKVITHSKYIDQFGKEKFNCSHPINKIWDMTEDLANLFGIWLGDGCLKKSKDNHIMGITFTVHKDNKEEIDFIVETSKKTFGCNISSTTHKNKNVTNITICSHIVGTVFYKLFGSYFNHKKLPNMVFGWSKKLINNLMAGLITTDGHLTKNCNATLGLSNKNLMNQLYHLCRNNGIDVSFVEGKISKGMTCVPYCMSIPMTTEILSKTHKLYTDDRVAEFHKSLIKNKNITNDKFLKIIDITETNKKDEFVYTLGVEDDHSYTVEGLLVENCYLEPWHCDIYEFCELRIPNTGNDDNRARDLFVALWVCDLFMKRVEKDEMWSLMCPDECPNLNKTHGKEFEELYEKYEQEKRYKKQVKARDLFEHILNCQLSSGMPYVAFKDHANNKSNQKNLGTICSSNLCIEIVEYSDENETAVCNLASLCLPRFINTGNNTKTFNFETLQNTARICIRNLNKVIDLNFYPTEKTKKSNMKHRPCGLGVQGLADVYNIMGFPFDSEQAALLNKQIFESIYFAAVDESCKLAQKYGHYDSFLDSPFSQGLLQYHLWGMKNSDLETKDLYDWDGLVERVKHYGTRNSLLTALMPTASTSQIMKCSECFEPYMSNIFTRSTLAGEFVVINENLITELENINLWNEEMRDLILINKGSVQNIDNIPQNIKNIYKTAYEIKLKSIVSQSADRGPFIDQSQSMNLFLEEQDRVKLRSALFYGWKRGIKTGMYYLRTTSAVDPLNFGVDIDKTKKKKIKYEDEGEDVGEQNCRKIKGCVVCGS